MIEIVLGLCLIENPKRCTEDRLTFEADNVSLFSCMTYGQFAIAEHMQVRPRWRVDRWRCQNAGVTAKI